MIDFRRNCRSRFGVAICRIASCVCTLYTDCLVYGIKLNGKAAFGLKGICVKSDRRINMGMLCAVCNAINGPGSGQ